MTRRCDELLARNLKKIRDGLGLSQAQVAQNTECYTRAAIGHKETNERPLYAADLKLFANALGLDLLDFVSLLFEEPPDR